ncbi:nickel-dependent lactate racemase, partial [bacterium]|nr:nickel-dependent lactate racemase [bacterium]
LPAPSTAIAAALTSPLDAPDLSQFLAGASTLLIIVNDRTRTTPTAAILAEIEPLLAGLDVTVLVATGTHRAPTEDEISEILGPLHGALSRNLVVHDARDESSLVHVGTTPRGTPVRVNRLARESERTLIIGSVEPHYFAGWTGGRKSILPGVCAFETIVANHSHSMSPASLPTALEGNPVHDDMMDATLLVADERFYSIQAVLDRNNRIYAVTAGELDASFRTAVGHAEDLFVVDTGPRAGLVVAAAPPPLDINLYQAHKAIEHGKLALADGGVLLLIAACLEGIGEETFVRTLTEAEAPEDALAALVGPYRFGRHKVARLVEAVTRWNVWAKTKLSDDVISGVFFRPVHDLQAVIDEALAADPETRAVVLPSASITVPRAED